MHIGDIVIHFEETLDDAGISGLEKTIGEAPGVLSAYVNEKTRHLMVVDFDPAVVRPSRLVQTFRDRGLHAVMVGL